MTTIAIVDCETVGLNAAVHGIWEVAVILHDVVAGGFSTPPPPDDREYVWQLPVDLMHADPDALRISRFYERRWRTPPPMPHDDFAEEWFHEAVQGYPDDVIDPGTVDGERFVAPIESMALWATRFASLTSSTILVGANPSFDEKRLSMLMRAVSVAPAWHYRPICVETLAAGYLRGIWAPHHRKMQETNNWQQREERDRWRKQTALTATVNGRVEFGEISLPWSSTHLSGALGIPRRSDAHTALGDCRWARDLWVKTMEDQ